MQIQLEIHIVVTDDYEVHSYKSPRQYANSYPYEPWVHKNGSFAAAAHNEHVL